MRKLNFALFSDVIFFALCAFLICFTAVRFYVNSALTALIFAIGGAIIAAIIAFVILYGKRQKQRLNFVNEGEKKSLSLHLSVSNTGEVKNLIKNALDGGYMGGNRLFDEQNEYFLHFKLSPLSPDDIAKVIQAESDKNKCVICCEVSPAALSFADDFDISVKTVGWVYNLLKDKGMLPEKYALGKVSKPTFLSRIKKRFSRRLCPSLFFCGLTLLGFSFFTTFPVYYVVSGGLLMALAAVSLFF